jgi:hypothetical protein
VTRERSSKRNSTGVLPLRKALAPRGEARRGEARRGEARRGEARSVTERSRVASENVLGSLVRQLTKDTPKTNHPPRDSLLPCDSRGPAGLLRRT